MPDDAPMPIVGVPVTLSTDNPRRMPQHSTGDRYLRALAQGAGAMPMLVPALGDAIDFRSLAKRIDGLLLTGGRANVEPHHYNGPPFPEDEIVDPARDATVLPLIRACVDRGVPVFGICRGIQEINVALGGTLHYRIHLLPGKMDHRMRRDVDSSEERMALRHMVSLAPGGLLAGLLGEPETMVNSLHGQGVDRPAPGMEIEALSPDGVIEAMRLKDAGAFTVGVQWHAEAHYDSHRLSGRLFAAFGEAVREHARARGRFETAG
jgi:putative glutamine amidotransferase